MFRALSLVVALWILAHRIPVGGRYWAIVALFTFDLVVLAGSATRHEPAARYARIAAVGALLMGVGDSIRLVMPRRMRARHG